MTRPPSHRRGLSLPIVAAALIAGCYVNEAQESAGNDASQDSGLHIRLDGNFVLNRDGSRVVTTALLDDDGVHETHLVGLSLPDMTPLIGPTVRGSASPELMLTPDPSLAWLVTASGHGLVVEPLFLDTMTTAAPLDLPSGDFNAAILSGDGRRLVLGEVWNTRDPHGITLLDMPLPPEPLTRTTDALTLDLPGALFDARFTRDGARLVVLTVPVDGERHFERAATVSVYDTSVAGAAPLLGRFHLDGFALNLLGLLTWSIRISPDGHFAAVSGTEHDVATTHVIDLAAVAYHGAYACDGPVGFTPDSHGMIGFDDLAAGQSQLVISDLYAGTSEAITLDYRNPIYWISPDGTRVVTYPFGARGLVITDLDTMESVRSSGADVALDEFVVGPDADFIYLVDHGGLYLLDIELGEVTQLESTARDYDNINILPDGDRLILAAEDTTRFDLWSVVTASVERSRRLPTRL
ncbi:MAG: hypothetical protein EP329_14450 [Deltaproteobacteria bacterium]|nr:MAG: hypothetical protein EP329_14450 [Deltaproteobacteria bacterium]